MSDDLQLIFAPNGKNGKGTMTARRGETAIFHDEVNLSKLDSRKQFADRLVAACPGVPRDVIESELMRQGADRTANSAKPTGNGSSPLGEVDAANVVRPERFILPDANGICIPYLSDNGGAVVGRWKLYLQWDDGRREARDLGPYLDIASGRVWFSPDPASPSASSVQSLGGWSAASRRDWLNDVTAPDPAGVFRSMAESFAYFVDLPDEHAAGTCATVVLWSMLTYCYQAWPAVPYLHPYGPAGSGKTRVLDFLGRTSFRPLSSSNLTGPALFRTLHDRGGCLLFDEAERLKQTQSPDVGELLSMLLAGYRRGGQATRLEAVGDKFQTVSFDVYGPKVLACIAGLPTALATRCIPIAMFRAPPGSEKPRRRIDADPTRWQTIRDDLHRLTLAYGSTWRNLAERIDVCPEMSGRDFELWQPLLALASWLESFGIGGLHSIVQEHALRTIDDNRDDHTPDADETLLRIIAEAYRGHRWLTSAEVLAEAQRQDNRTFGQWGPRAVSGRLKSYGIPSPRKIGSRREYRDVTEATLARVQVAYGIDLDVSDEVKS